MGNFIEMSEFVHCRKCWEQFGKCIKLGVHVNSTNRTKIAELLRLHSSKSGEVQISVKE